MASEPGAKQPQEGTGYGYNYGGNYAGYSAIGYGDGGEGGAATLSGPCRIIC